MADPTQPIVAKSLARAGIGKAYHGATLLDPADPVKRGLFAFLVRHNTEVTLGRQCAVFDGVPRDAVMILAQTMHLHGIGVRFLTLRQFQRIRKRGGEEWEDLLAQKALFLVAQNEMPLPFEHYYEMADIEEWVAERMDADRSTYFLWEGVRFPNGGWWTQTFRDRLAKLPRMTPASLTADAKTLKGDA